MVSKASEDFPDPLSPVITVRVLRGISTSMFFRLCWRAPRTVMLVMGIDRANKSLRNMDGCTERAESDRRQLCLCILFANGAERQRGADGCSACDTGA